MFICLDCHRQFDNPETKYGLGGYPEEPTYHCPYCDSMEFDEAEELRFNTLVASYFYACFLLVVALVIICIVGDGDCDGDCCDCDCCDCGNGGKKKKEKKDTKTDEVPKEKRNFGNLESLKGIVSPVLKTLGKLLDNCSKFIIFSIP